MVVETSMMLSVYPSEQILESRLLGSLRNCQTPKINAKQNETFNSLVKRRLANYIS